jgi:hypothetical protein
MQHAKYGYDLPMPYQCDVCREWVPGTKDGHNCPGVPLPSIKLLWGLTSISSAEMNAYTFPDLAGITKGMSGYIEELNVGVGGAPAVSLNLKTRKPITDPGMVLMLGNPMQGASGAIISHIMNERLPGVSYRTIHTQYKGPSTFTWTQTKTASEFFQQCGAIAIMPSDASYAGTPPATQLPDGGVLVNAHSKCVAGLMVHEIFHCYGGPAGFIGEGLTDWFAIDFMKSINDNYSGNPAYAYQVSVVDRLVKLAGKKRVARLAFCDKSTFESMAKVKVGIRDVTAASVYSGIFSNLGDWAFDARVKTMEQAGLGNNVVPIPASPEMELSVGSAGGVPGQIKKMAEYLIKLMDKVT